MTKVNIHHFGKCGDVLSYTVRYYSGQHGVGNFNQMETYIECLAGKYLTLYTSRNT